MRELEHKPTIQTIPIIEIHPTFELKIGDYYVIDRDLWKIIFFSDIVTNEKLDKFDEGVTSIYLQWAGTPSHTGSFGIQWFRENAVKWDPRI